MYDDKLVMSTLVQRETALQLQTEGNVCQNTCGKTKKKRKD